jgi:hypothetical protein
VNDLPPPELVTLDPSEAKLKQLAYFYNEDFGIAQGDDLEMKKIKFLTWLRM